MRPFFRRPFVLLCLAGIFILGIAPLSADPVPSQFTNTLGMKFLPLPGTSTLLCLWPTRVDDYRAFILSTGRNWPRPDFSQSGDHPAVCVTWEDAKAFTNWLTEKEQTAGKLPKDWHYRLPTDAEWSIAVGESTDLDGGQSSDSNYPWGTSWPPPPKSGNYNPSLQVDPFPYTSPVGSFKANKLGFYDTSGNVWQWCEDFFNRSADYRILRGASWRMRDPDDLLLSKRIGNRPDTCLSVYGFRVAIETPKTPGTDIPAAPAAPTSPTK